jgi:hypothetical protein
MYPLLAPVLFFFSKSVLRSPVRSPKEIFARWLSKIITPNFPLQRSFLKQFSKTEIQSADKF